MIFVPVVLFPAPRIEQQIARGELERDARHGPHVRRRRVLGTQNHLRAPVLSRLDILRELLIRPARVSEVHDATLHRVDILLGRKRAATLRPGFLRRRGFLPRVGGGVGGGGFARLGRLAPLHDVRARAAVTAVRFLRLLLRLALLILRQRGLVSTTLGRRGRGLVSTTLGRRGRGLVSTTLRRRLRGGVSSAPSPLVAARDRSILATSASAASVALPTTFPSPRAAPLDSAMSVSVSGNPRRERLHEQDVLRLEVGVDDLLSRVEIVQSQEDVAAHSLDRAQGNPR